MTTGERVRIDGRVYQRDLPGGGYVAIEHTTHFEGDREVPRTRVSVERRTETERRSGHTPPVIAEVDGVDTSTAELYSVAADNVAIARALLDWQRRPRAD